MHGYQVLCSTFKSPDVRDYLGWTSAPMNALYKQHVLVSRLNNAQRFGQSAWPEGSPLRAQKTGGTQNRPENCLLVTFRLWSIAKPCVPIAPPAASLCA